MDGKVVEFTALLRRNGVRVSLAETMDAFRALDAIGLSDRDTVRAALRTTAVKRSVDVPTFDRLFDLYFSGLGEAIREVTAATQAALGLDEDDFERFLQQLEELLREQGIEMSPLAQALLRADAGRLEQMMRDAARQARLDQIEHGFQEGRFTHALAAALGLGELGAEMERLRRVVHSLIWVNPLKVTPGYAPLARGMAAALPHVDHFVEGHSLAAMEELAAVIAGGSVRN